MRAVKRQSHRPQYFYTVLHGIGKMPNFAGDFYRRDIVKRIAIISITAVMLAFSSAAQHSVVSEAKKLASGLTMTVDSYNKAFKKLQPALTNDETRERAETWALANRIKIEQFDKYMDNRRVGKKIDAKAMGYTLIDAYDYAMTALQLDTIRILDKNDQPIIDKKTKRPKYKTKFSAIHSAFLK